MEVLHLSLGEDGPPQQPCRDGSGLYGPDGHAFLRVIVTEGDEWGTLAIEPDYGPYDQGPPTCHPLFHEIGYEPLGEIFSDGEDVWLWCLQNGLAPGQRAWISLEIWYVGGGYEYPHEYDRECVVTIASIEPMDPHLAAERWEAFLWRRSQNPWAA